jgi:hypothetical protein
MSTMTDPALGTLFASILSGAPPQGAGLPPVVGFGNGFPAPSGGVGPLPPRPMQSLAQQIAMTQPPQPNSASMGAIVGGGMQRLGRALNDAARDSPEAPLGPAAGAANNNNDPTADGYLAGDLPSGEMLLQRTRGIPPIASQAPFGPPANAAMLQQLLQQQAGGMGAGYQPHGLGSTAGSYDTGGLPPVNQSLVQQAMANQDYAKYATLNPDMAKRFGPGGMASLVGKFSYKNDLPPLVESIVKQSNLALPDWQVAPKTPSIGSVDSMTPERIAAMPPGPIRDAAQRRLEALTVHSQNGFGDYVDSTPTSPMTTAAEHQRGLDAEHAASLIRSERRAAMHGRGDSNLEAFDRSRLAEAGKDFGAIHDAAEGKRSILAQSILGGGGPFGMSWEQMQGNPDLAGHAMRAYGDQQRTAAEGKWHDADIQAKKDIARGENESRERVEERRRQADEDARDQTYKALEMQVAWAAQKGTKPEFDAANNKLTAYSTWKASQRGMHGGAPQGASGAMPPAPGMPPELLKSLTAPTSPATPAPVDPQTRLTKDDIETELDRLLDQEKGIDPGHTGIPTLRPDRAKEILTDWSTRGLTTPMLRDYRAGTTYGGHTAGDRLKDAIPGYGAFKLGAEALGLGPYNKENRDRNNRRRQLIDEILRTPQDQRRA